MNYLNKIIIRQANEFELQLIEEMHAKRLFAWGLESRIDLKEPKVYLALLDKKIIGFCKFGEKGKKPEGFILRLEVLKEFQRKKHEQSVKRTSFFYRRGIHKVHAVVDQPAIDFFRRTGYKIKTFFGGGTGKGVADMSRPLERKKRNRPR